MDVGLRWGLNSIYGTFINGFNPCFNGCRSAMVDWSSYTQKVVEFQSLF